MMWNPRRCRLVRRVGEHEVIEQLCDPAVIALVEGFLGGPENILLTAHHIDVAPGGFLRR